MNEETQNFIVEQIQNTFSQFLNNRVTTETVDTPMNQVNEQVDAHISEYPRLQILEAIIILYSCPKNSAIKYTPPAKVASMTRPVDFMIHKCIQDGVTQIPVDHIIGFTNNIRLMLPDLASHMTQLRIERVQMHANNNERAHRLKEIHQKANLTEDLSLSLANKILEHNKIITLNNSNKAKRSTPAVFLKQGEGERRRPHQFKKAWDLLSDSKWVSKIIREGYQIPLQVGNSGTSTEVGLESRLNAKAQEVLNQNISENKLQNGNFEVGLQNYTKKRLKVINRPTAKIISSESFPLAYLCVLTSLQKVLKDSNRSVFRRHINTGRDKGNMRKESEVGLEPTNQIRLFNPRVQIQPFSGTNNITLENANRFAENVAKSSKELNQGFKTRSNQVIKYGQNITEKSVVLYKKSTSTSYGNSCITWALNVASIKPAKKPSDVNEHELESDARYHRKCIGEFNLVERQANQLEWAIPKSTLSKHINSKELLAIQRALRMKEVVGNFVKVYTDNTTSISYIRKFGGTQLCSFNPEPGRRAISNVSLNRMTIKQFNIPEATDEIWLTRRRLIRNKRECPAIELLQLVQRKKCNITECNDSMLEAVEHTLLLPTMELNTQHYTKNQKRKDNDDVNNTILAVSNMIPRCSANELLRTIENNSVKHKRKRLQNQGLNKQAIEIITGDSSAFRLQKQYNNTLDNKRLTRKTCWLLSVNGFLRPSDICFIDLNNSKIINGALRLYIVAPKEKRGSQSITKTCTIGPHDEPLLCSVEAFKAYIAKIAVIPCNSAHPSRAELSINYLVRSLKDNSKQIGAQRIGKHINTTSVLIPGFANTIRPKGKAIGSTLAAQSGVPLHEIVTYGNWSSLHMFDSYYRLSRGSNKLTKAIMTLDSHTANL
ncbi:hypothetical protein BB561_003917 [Smittium simulii]|uniref:Uncharacterized protein n=1 Tax=Smittium simulii TaxID=133385 RepID=A0A2T9YIY9_9FUNG|nr:hypothetical protein BB561_003917 [Smittium simulii]